MQKGFVGILVLIVVLLAVVAGGAYYLGTQKPSPTPTPQPSPSDETANWKTYTTANPKFSIRYPDGWEIDKWTDTRKVGNRSFKETNIDFGDPSSRTQSGTAVPRVSLSFAVDPDLADVSIEEFSLVKTGAYLRPDEQPKWSSFTVSGYTWSVVSNLYGQGGYRAEFYLKKGDAMFELSGVEDPEPTHWPDYFRQMIATFRLDE